MRDRETVTFWVGGLLLGLGSGIVIARTVPPPQAEPQASVQSDSVEKDRTERHLHDPSELPETSSSGFQDVPAQAPGQSFQPPRLLPTGDASPLSSTMEEEEVASEEKTTASETESPAIERPTASEFRDELEASGDELSSEALDELSIIRELIEGTATNRE